MPGAASASCSAARIRSAAADQSVIDLDTAVSQKVGTNVMVRRLRDHAGVPVGVAGPYLSSKDQVEVEVEGRARRVRRIYSSDSAGR